MIEPKSPVKFAGSKYLTDSPSPHSLPIPIFRSAPASPPNVTSAPSTPYGTPIDPQLLFRRAETLAAPSSAALSASLPAPRAQHTTPPSTANQPATLEISPITAPHHERRRRSKRTSSVKTPPATDSVDQAAPANASQPTRRQASQSRHVSSTPVAAPITILKRPAAPPPAVAANFGPLSSDVHDPDPAQSPPLDALASSLKRLLNVIDSPRS